MRRAPRDQGLVGSRNRVAARTAIWILLAGAVFGCGGKKTAAPPPPPVTIATPIRGDVQMSVEFTGTTRAIESAEIRARVPGILTEMHFEASSIVDKGDLLFVIERESYKAARDAAYADLKAAEAELARAESDLKRIQTAIESNAVSQQDLDLAVAKRDQADALLLRGQATLDKADLDYSYTLVRTPIAGQVARRLIDIGNLVGQGDATLLTTVNKMHPIYVYFDAPERVVLQFSADRQKAVRDSDVDTTQVGRVLVKLANETEFHHEGRIDYIDNTVNPSTGTIELRAVLDNENYLLFPGLFVRIRVLGAIKRNTLLVQERALGTDIGGKYVLLVGEDNIVEQRYVQLGPLQDDGTIVVLDGLEGDERYIVNGILRARPGLPVQPTNEEEARAQAESE